MNAQERIKVQLQRLYDEVINTGDVDRADLYITPDRPDHDPSLPPSPTWFSGRAAVKVHAASLFSRPEFSRWRLQPTRANNQFAFAGYRRDEIDGLYYAHALQVLALTGTQITEIHMFFLPQIFPRFGLASTY